MARRKVIAVPLRYKCPLCGRHSRNLRGLALHLAMKRDSVHKDWRRRHGLPEDYETRKEAMSIAKSIEKIIRQDEEKYRTYVEA